MYDPFGPTIKLITKKDKKKGGSEPPFGRY